MGGLGDLFTFIDDQIVIEYFHECDIKKLKAVNIQLNKILQKKIEFKNVLKAQEMPKKP